MSYGMQIRTSAGLVDVANINVARFLASYTRTNNSGTITQSNFSNANNLGHIWISTNDGKIVPDFTWNNSTKVLSYFKPLDQSGNNLISLSEYSSNFTITFALFD